MRYSCLSSVEYDLKLHYTLLDEYQAELHQAKEYRGYLIKPTKIRGTKKYYSVKAPDSQKFQYLGNENNPTLEKIRECAFLEKTIEVLESNIALMEGFLLIYKKTGAYHINELLGSTYGLRSTSRFLNADENADQWLTDQMKIKSQYPIFDPAGLKVTAFDGTLMRSRAEAIHYEAFYIYNIPAIFELPYDIDGEILRPDFTILDVYTMTPRMWEHLGNWFHEKQFKRDNYRNETLHRIDEYAKIGFYPEYNLLFSFGTQNNVFDIQSLHRKIAMFALPPPSMETMNMLLRK